MLRHTLSRKTINKLLEPTGYRISKFRTELPPAHPAPLDTFHSYDYLRHNARRQEHLASLGLPLTGRTVLEVGAGAGDHTHFFLDRGCSVVVTEARAENLEILKARYPQLQVRELDLEKAHLPGDEKFDIVYCYGLLYHLNDPAWAIEFMAQRCRGLLLLETCVSFGSDLQVNLCDEQSENPSQAFSGKGCRPTRPWVFAELHKRFPFVYMPRTQPWLEDFPLDWTAPAPPSLTRSVFIGSRESLVNELLAAQIPVKQRRH
jgi:SAM-dependent methyltransferase